MRRVLAFSIDFFIASVISVFLWAVFGFVFSISVPSYILFFVVFPLTFSVLEVRFNGVTAGRYVFGLRLVDLNCMSISPFLILARGLFFFVFTIALSFVLAFLFRVFWGESEIRFEYLFSGFIIGVANLILFAFSFGKQNLSDALFKTAVVSHDRLVSRYYSFRAVFLSFLFIVLASVAALFYFGNKDSYLYQGAHAEKFSSFASDSEIYAVRSVDLDPGIEDFNSYYDGEHYFTGLKKLSEVQKALGFIYENGEMVSLPETLITSNLIKVTFRGIFNDFYMDYISRSVFKKQNEKTGAPASVVGFLYFEDFFGLFYIKIYTWRLVGPATSGEVGSTPLMVLSPERNYSFSPGFVFGMSPMVLATLEQNAIIEVNSLF